MRVVPVVVVLFEDEYETSFGDGYYAYVSSAFPDRATAQAYRDAKAAEPRPANTLGYRYHLREGVLREQADGAWAFEGPLDPGDRIDVDQVRAALAIG